eukprot:4386472-Prymnesium_polylepis.2
MHTVRVKRAADRKWALQHGATMHMAGANLQTTAARGVKGRSCGTGRLVWRRPWPTAAAPRPRGRNHAHLWRRAGRRGSCRSSR